MKVTKLTKNNKKLTNNQLNAVARIINNTMRGSLGFLIDVEVLNSSLKIGYQKCQFKINTTRHGYNTQHSHGRRKLTSLPTWDQRVEFNNALNAIFDSLNLSAKIVSGPFTIRNGLQIYGRPDWDTQKPEYITHNEALGYYVARGNYKLQKEIE
jgi:hypothetical protein